MLDWKALQSEYDQLIEKLADSDLDSRTRAQFQKRAAQLSEVLNVHNQLALVDKTICDCEQELSKDAGDMRELYAEELAIAQDDRVRLEAELEDILYPADPRDDRSVFLEIRAGAGGQEAALFAADLFKMYSNYALRKGWPTSVVEESYTDLGGFKELIMHIQGRQIYKFLKFESGVHRVQRVPKTEGAGRVHTSTVTVAVMPELDDVEVTLNQGDLRIDTYRAGGAGGQHVNKTDSAVRITHIPSGLVVACQDERSQLKNKQKAMKLLQSRLFEHEKEKQEAAISAARKQQVGTGDRAEKIRTYNFPQNRITDHRTEVTLKKLDIIMQGDMDDLLYPLVDWDRAQRKEKATV